MKNINTILFDLDGTLLPMDVDGFSNSYMYEIEKHFSEDTNPKSLIKYIWESTKAMVENTGLNTNETVFWKSFHALSENKLLDINDKFEEFYETRFPNLKSSTSKDENMIKSVYKLKEMGYTVVVATNPIFPEKAIHQRVEWAGFNINDFVYISSFEKNHYCKPQIEYYKEILSSIDKTPDECMMVGNDMKEDLVAGNLGLKTWLVTNSLIEDKEKRFNPDYKGTSKDFFEFIKKMPLRK